jgi:hypothetical protein
MRNKFNQFVAHPLGKLFLIEVVILGIVGLLSIVMSFTYSTGLMLIGAGILFLRFTASGTSAPGLTRGPFAYELYSQQIRESKDPNQIKQRFALMSDLLIIGFIPLAVGVVLSLLRY